MNVQPIIDSAINANVTTVAINEATKIFRAAVKCSIKVTENLSIKQRQLLIATTDLPLVFTPSKRNLSDHAIIAALRCIIREAYEQCFKIKHTTMSTLMVGATGRELGMYWENPNIHYYFYGKEAKDYVRIVRPIIDDIVNRLKIKTNLGTKQHVKLKTYNTLSGLLQDASTLTGTYCSLTPTKANQLVFEDTIYNFNKESLIDLFDKTEASVGFGYALMPYELIFSDMPQNLLYHYYEHDECCTTMATLTWRHGCSNGYTHKKSNWSTLLLNPIIKGEKFSLIVQLEKFVGPMCYFQIIRTRNSERIARTIELPDNMKFVKILDIYNNFNAERCVLARKKYISVHQQEFYDCVSYLSACDPQTLNITNTVAYVRRRRGGISLSGSELLKAWHLSESHEYTFALTCMLYTMFEVFKTKFAINSVLNSERGFANWLREHFNAALSRTVDRIMTYLFGAKLKDSLVIYPEHNGCIHQYERIGKCVWFENHSQAAINADLYVTMEPPEDKVMCEFCDKYIKKPQLALCSYKQDSTHNWCLTQEDITNLGITLSSNETDNDVMTKIKTKAREQLPHVGFEYQTKVHYICGGPGTGKSQIVRAMADKADLIVGPFRRLKADYMNTDKGDLYYKTQHTALSERNRERIFVDEFSSYPYELLAALVYLTGAKEVFLCGDHRQCKVLEQLNEGVYIGDRIDLDSIDKHELLMNFRNPSDIVARLNATFGYKMVTENKVTDSLEILDAIKDADQISQLMEDNKCSRLFFSNAGSKLYQNSEEFTIRKYQGATCKSTIVFTDGTVPQLMTIEALQIVAISRHMEKCYIVDDGSSASRVLIEKLKITPEFREHIQQFLKFPDTQTKGLQLGLNEEVYVEPIVKPTYDSYKAITMIMPVITVDPDVKALNEYHRNVISSKFKRARTNIALLFPISHTGKPVRLSQTYYAIGPGYGLQFSAKGIWQELAVVSKRYDGYRTRFDFNSSAYEQVTDMVDEYFFECKQKIKVNLNDEYILNDMVTKFLMDARTKHYYSKVSRTLLDWLDINVIRFNLKSAFKPLNTDKGLNLYKVGQGISGWSVYLSSMFCMAFRFIQYIDQLTNRDDENSVVITDNGLDEIEFFTEVQEAYKRTFKYNEPVQNGTTDAVEFDSMQNEFTQNIEYQYLIKLGVNVDFLNIYFQFRSNSPIVGKFFKSTLGYEKASGEPGTLLNNGIVSKVISNYIIRGDGPKLCLYKGDDHNKIQMNLRIDEQRRKWIKQQCDIDFKLWVRPEGEFCGLLVTKENIVPNIMRRVIKLTGARWKDHDHFVEYQQSLRDYVKLIQQCGVNKCIAAVMKTYNITYENSMIVYDLILSFSHISASQWASIVVRRTDNLYVPTSEDGGRNINVKDDVDPSSRRYNLLDELEPEVTGGDISSMMRKLSKAVTGEDYDHNNCVANYSVEEYLCRVDHNCPRSFGIECDICKNYSMVVVNNHAIRKHNILYDESDNSSEDESEKPKEKKIKKKIKEEEGIDHLNPENDNYSSPDISMSDLYPEDDEDEEVQGIKVNKPNKTKVVTWNMNGLDNDEVKNELLLETQKVVKEENKLNNVNENIDITVTGTTTHDATVIAVTDNKIELQVLDDKADPVENDIFNIDLET